MKRSNLFSLILSTSILFIGCSSPSGNVAPRTTPTPNSGNSSTPLTDVSSAPNSLPIATPVPAKKFDEPLTDALFPNPVDNVNSYGKILRAIDRTDFEFIELEYNKGGLKFNALKADSRFNDFPSDFTARSLIANVGKVGLDNREVTSINSTLKKQMLRKVLEQVFIYSVRNTGYRLIENNSNPVMAQEDKYTTDVAKEMYVYFYGSENKQAADNSVAKLTQLIDNENKLEKKTFDSIISGINLMNNSAKGKINNLNLGINQIDIGFYKTLYMATLQNLALALKAREENSPDAAQHLINAEFSFMGIRNPAKVTNGPNNSFLEVMLSNTDFRLIEYDKVQRYLNAGFAERVTDQMALAVNKINTDTESAQKHALASTLYMDIINSSYDNGIFSRQENTQWTNLINGFVNAIKSKNAKLANDIYTALNGAITPKL